MIHEPHNRVDVTTPQGDGVIWLVTEYGHETDTMYTIILNNGEIWQFTHKDIRVKDNVTFNRVFTKTEKSKAPQPTPTHVGGFGIAVGSYPQICSEFVVDSVNTSQTKCMRCNLEKWQHPIKSLIAGM
jgi:hypothetical protein